MRIGTLVMLVVLSLAIRPVYSQSEENSYTLMASGMPMQQALEQLVTLTHIDLIYSSRLVDGKYVYCTSRAATAEALLQCVLAGSGLDYIRSSAGTYVLIEARRQPPLVGDLAGRIYDAATGDPLPYANVLLADASTGTASDDAGLFSFSSLLAGLHRVVVTYVGYETAVDTVWVAAGSRERVQIALQPSAVMIEPVVIHGLAQRLPSHSLGLGALFDRQLAAIPALTTGDVARGAATFTGVSIRQPLADLHIQGGATGEHLMLLDGVPVRNPVSLGRHLSAFSPLAIDRMTVHKAGFGVEHGSHLSGVIAIEQDVAGPSRRGVVVNADPVSLNGKAQGRFSGPGQMEGAAMVAARTSLWPIYRDPGTETLLRHWNAVDPWIATRWTSEPVTSTTLGVHRYTPEVAFSDIHAAARLHLSPFRTLHASAYRARNRLAARMTALNVVHPDEPALLFLTDDDYDWTNWAGQLRHTWLMGARTVGTMRTQGSWHQSRYAYHSLDERLGVAPSPAHIDAVADSLRPALLATEGASYENHQIRELTAEATLSHSLTPNRHLDAGLGATRIDSQFRFKNPFFQETLAHEAGTWELAGYLQGRWALGLQTTLEPGLRLTYLPARRAVYAEPRLALRYDQPTSRAGAYALRLAGGLYRQYVNQFELSSYGVTSVVPSVLFWLPIERSLAPPRVVQVVADVLWMPGPAWTINLEGYLKEQARLLTLDYAALQSNALATAEADQVPQSAFISSTHGRAYGGAVRVQRAGTRLTTTASYSLSRAHRRFPGRFSEQLVPVPWNTPHRLMLNTDISLTSGLQGNLTWEGAWGQQWAFNRAYYDYLAFFSSPLPAAFDLNRPADQSLPAYYRLDAGLSYEHAWRRASIQVRAFVVNVLDRQNVFRLHLEKGETDNISSVARTLPGRHPVFSIQVGY